MNSLVIGIWSRASLQVGGLEVWRLGVLQSGPVTDPSLSLQWDLVCDDKRLNQALATYFFVGVMIGAVLFGQLSDK